jgi:hypothetical protein
MVRYFCSRKFKRDDGVGCTPIYAPCTDYETRPGCPLFGSAWCRISSSRTASRRFRRAADSTSRSWTWSESETYSSRSTDTSRCRPLWGCESRTRPSESSDRTGDAQLPGYRHRVTTWCASPSVRRADGRSERTQGVSRSTSSCCLPARPPPLGRPPDPASVRRREAMPFSTGYPVTATAGPARDDGGGPDPANTSGCSLSSR